VKQGKGEKDSYWSQSEKDLLESSVAEPKLIISSSGAISDFQRVSAPAPTSALLVTVFTAFK
jgi:hypothetical protein